MTGTEKRAKLYDDMVQKMLHHVRASGPVSLESIYDHCMEQCNTYDLPQADITFCFTEAWDTCKFSMYDIRSPGLTVWSIGSDSPSIPEES
jgi:hypothetical protein